MVMVTKKKNRAEKRRGSNACSGCDQQHRPTSKQLAAARLRVHCQRQTVKAVESAFVNIPSIWLGFLPLWPFCRSDLITHSSTSVGLVCLLIRHHTLFVSDSSLP